MAMNRETSRREAARRMGVDPSTLALRERGERVPTGAVLERIGGFSNGTAKRGRMKFS